MCNGEKVYLKVYWLKWCDVILVNWLINLIFNDLIKIFKNKRLEKFKVYNLLFIFDNILC